MVESWTREGTYSLSHRTFLLLLAFIHVSRVRRGREMGAGAPVEENTHRCRETDMHTSPHSMRTARIPRWPKGPPVTSGLGASSFVLPVSWRDSLDKGEKSTSPKTSWAYACLEGKWLERDNLQGSSSPSAVQGASKERAEPLVTLK